MDKEFDRDEELKKIEAKIKDAEDNLGDVELRDAILEKAEFYVKINEKDHAIDIFK